MSAVPSTRPPAPRPSYRPQTFVADAVIADKYQLVRRLGMGGMGVVWVAHNRVLDVHVAIKVIDLEQAQNPERIGARLLQEARAAARLAHPAICRVFDFGRTEAGDPFIVSELLHGETLGDLMATRGRVGAVQAVQLLLPVFDGLSLAHAKGIVHRDIKPDNIFLSRDDVSRLQPKLLDFGIARLVDADHQITMDGTLLGTPDYMSPEQARGEADVDHRTDIWSAAVVLYELVSGERPFPGDNYNALLWAIVHESPRPLTETAAGDPELWAILGRALAKDRDERWGSLRELGEALARWLIDRGVTEDVCGGSLRTAWMDGVGGARAGDLGEESPNSAEIVTEKPTSVEHRPITGVFRSSRGPSAVVARRRLVLLASGAALVVGFFAVVLLTSARSDPATRDGGVVTEGDGAESASSPARPRETVPGVMVTPTELTSAVLSPGSLLTASATPSASASASAASVEPPAPRPRSHRRPSSKKPNPRTYDFGF